MIRQQTLNFTRNYRQSLSRTDAAKGCKILGTALVASRFQLMVQIARIYCAVDANTVPAFAFGTVKGGIGHFDKLDRVRRIIRKR